MRHDKTFVLLLSWCVVVCCGRSKEERAGGAETAAKEPARQASASNLLQIQLEMLRDLRVTTAKAEQRPGGESVKVVGELQVNQDRYAEVGTPVTARIVRLIAKPGQLVRTGEVLAEAQSVELGRARADYRTALGRVELARKTLERKRGLGVDRIVPRRELQEAEADLAAAQAQLESAVATLDALGGRTGGGAGGSRFPLLSPISGTVIERAIALGQMVEPGKAAFKVADFSTLWLVAHVFERDAVRVTLGTPARATLAAFPGQSFTGNVAYVGHQVEVSSRTIPVRVSLPNPQRLFQPGMSASAWLQVSAGRQPILVVPVAALQRLRESWVVFVPQSDRAFEVRVVGRGRDLEGEVEILNGLRHGETVVVDGAFLLKAEAEKAEGGGDHHDH